MKIITRAKQLESNRVVVWCPVTELKEIAKLCVDNPNYEPVLMYNKKAGSGILFFLTQVNRNNGKK